MSGLSTLADAYSARLMSRLDPMNQIVQQLATGDMQDQDLSRDRVRISLVEEISSKIRQLEANATESQPVDAAVLDCYRKMLRKYQGQMS